MLGSSCLALLAAGSCARSVDPSEGSAPSLGREGNQIQPSLATARDDTGAEWIIAGYTDLSVPDPGSVMGLAVRWPGGRWETYAPLLATGELQPSGDAWLATAQRGSRAYYVSLANDSDDVPNGIGEGVYLAVVDVANGAPVITPPRRIDLEAWNGWDEPTIAATRRPDRADETVLVAATPIGPELQDTLAVMVSNDGGTTFHYAPLVHAPRYPGPVDGPDNTVVRPILQQDPRAGQECHELLAFGVLYPTALEDTPGIAMPDCVLEHGSCRAIAESESVDCGESWSDPVFAVIDAGAPTAPDYRGFSYAVANDGTRAVMYPDEDSGDTRMLVKRAFPGEPFVVTSTVGGQTAWQDGSVEAFTDPLASGEAVRLLRPTLVGDDKLAAFWMREATGSHIASVRFAQSDPASPGVWTAPVAVDPRTDGVVCDALPNPLDNYMGATAETLSSGTGGGYVVAWTGFAPCGNTTSHDIEIGEVH